MTDTEALRRFVENLPDDVVRGIVEQLVRGIVQGIADEIADRAVDSILGQLATAADPSAAVAPALSVVETPAEPEPDAEECSTVHTCDLCGCTGERQFKRIGARWVCTRTDACAKKRAKRGPTPPPAEEKPLGARWPADPYSATEHANEPAPKRVTVIPAHVPTPRPTKPKPAPPTTQSASDVTARCQDCTRTWNLTGVVLDKAVEAHELAHSHVVTVIEQDQT